MKKKISKKKQKKVKGGNAPYSPDMDINRASGDVSDVDHFRSNRSGGSAADSDPDKVNRVDGNEILDAAGSDFPNIP